MSKPSPGPTWLPSLAPDNERERLAALCALQLLDTPPPAELDRITRLAANFFKVSIALVSLVDHGRQWFLSRSGLDASETGRDISFCGHAILGQQALVVEDARRDERFAGNPLVTGAPHIRFYAGQPIRTLQGYAIGTICLIDPQPRQLSVPERGFLQDFGTMVEQYLHAVESDTLARAFERRLHNTEALLSNTFAQAAVGMALVSLDGHWLRVNPRLCAILGYDEACLLAKTFQDVTHPADLESDLEQVRRILAGDIATYSMEKRYLRASGELIWGELTVSLMRDGNGAPLHFIAVVNDIDQRKRTELELAALHRDLEHRVAQRTLQLQQALEQLRHEMEREKQLLAELQSAKQLADLNAERFMTAAESHLDAYLILHSVRDGRGDIVDFRCDYLNREAEALFGLSRRQAIGQLLCQLLPVTRSSGFFDKYVAVVETATPLAEEFSLDVDYINASWMYQEVVKIGDGISISARNITARKHAEESLRLREALLRQVTDSIPVIVAFIDEEERYRYCNLAYFQTMAGEKEQLLGRSVREFLGDETYRLLQPHIRRALAGERLHFDRPHQKGGVAHELEIHYIPQRESEGRVAGFYVIGWDVTEQRKRELLLQNRAMHDAMTGLHNRAAFLELLDNELQRHRPAGESLALLFLDIDHFKHINDNFGHALGDEVIREFACRTRAAVRANDIVARLGGDEFVVLLPQIDTLAHAQQVAAKIRAALQAPAVLDNTALKISASIGLAYSASPGEHSAAALLACADKALYQAKAAGRDCWQSSMLE